MNSDEKKYHVVIIDLEMGNLFSIKNACEHAGLSAGLTSSSDDVVTADAVILPGMGAFGDAMDALRKYSLIPALKEAASSGKLIFGICLGMQLLMSEGTEFGSHEGLGFIKGIVVRLNNPATEAGALKVPQIGWNQLFRNKELSSNPWADTPLKGLPDGVYMYFNHSYYVIPENTKAVIAKSTYGNITFCSALRQENIIALQCHPERSGAYGLAVYQNLYRMIEHSM